MRSPAAGLVGNPSDGYFGKTISFVIRNFKATVRLWESPDFEIVPTHGDFTQFDTVESSCAISSCTDITAACG